MKVIKISENTYPRMLKEISSAPKELYVLGDEQLLNKTSIAIVGARDCDKYGRTQTERFSSYLAQNDICVVSGLARGVDSFAHNKAKDKPGKTIAVLASGFNHIYPKENRVLFDEILENGGCIISEWEPNTEVEMNRFPRRNRIISGLSVATLVIEAKYRSGTSITAHYAMKQRREVFCIPGNIDSINSYGTNKLISEGAMLITSPKEILEMIEHSVNHASEKTVIEPKYKEIYELIGDIPVFPDEISRKLKTSVSEINQKLLIMEIDNFIEKTKKGGYIKKYISLS